MPKYDVKYIDDAVDVGSTKIIQNDVLNRPIHFRQQITLRSVLSVSSYSLAKVVWKRHCNFFNIIYIVASRKLAIILYV